jgi:hypothetical protein
MLISRAMNVGTVLTEFGIWMIVLSLLGAGAQKTRRG